jgi:hypothetical protein
MDATNILSTIKLFESTKQIVNQIISFRLLGALVKVLNIELQDKDNMSDEELNEVIYRESMMVLDVYGSFLN